MDAVFRSFRDADADELVNMVEALYREDSEGEPMDVSKVMATIREFKRNPQKLNIVIFQMGQDIVGYAILVYFWSNEYGGNILVIDELYVKDKYRSKGMGTAFISAVVASDDVVALQLETTPANRRALAYYRRLGFEQTENTRLVMVKCRSR